MTPSPPPLEHAPDTYWYIFNRQFLKRGEILPQYRYGLNYGNRTSNYNFPAPKCFSNPLEILKFGILLK